MLFSELEGRVPGIEVKLELPQCLCKPPVGPVVSYKLVEGDWVEGTAKAARQTSDRRQCPLDFGLANRANNVPGDEPGPVKYQRVGIAGAEEECQLGQDIALQAHVDAHGKGGGLSAVKRITLPSTNQCCEDAGFGKKSIIAPQPQTMSHRVKDAILDEAAIALHVDKLRKIERILEARAEDPIARSIASPCLHAVADTTEKASYDSDAGVGVP